MKRKAKPETPAAKAQAEFESLCRQKHPKFDYDVTRYGREVAIYNAGFLDGSTHDKRKEVTHAALGLVCHHRCRRPARAVASRHSH